MNPEHSVLRVRRSIHIKASPDRVWNEFTTFELMDRWWGARIGDPVAGTSKGQFLLEYTPRVGGRIEMAVDMGGQRVRYGGDIKVFNASRELTFENDWIPNQGWTAPTYVTLRLAPALDGTLVELFHHGFEHTGGDVGAEHAGYEQGWGMTQLSALKAAVEATG
jgi:uncharacterized protein YndB with AHSA1/START domain